MTAHLFSKLEDSWQDKTFSLFICFLAWHSQTMNDLKFAGFCLLFETGLKENAMQGGLVGLMILSVMFRDY